MRPEFLYLLFIQLFFVFSVRSQETIDLSGEWHEHGQDLQVPKGFLGTLYLFYHDGNNLERTGTIEFEGRTYQNKKHDKDGKWIKLLVMRDDSNDGDIEVYSKKDKGAKPGDPGNGFGRE